MGPSPKLRQVHRGEQVVARLVVGFRIWRASVTLWTSVAPSARPMWNDSRTIAPNGISSETPSEPWTCSARDATSWSTWGIAAFTAEMSARTRW